MILRVRRLPISLACVLVASMATMTVSAQKSGKRPSLVVGIVIDGLDIDRIYQLKDHFGANGFNRLLAKGVTITDLDYGSRLDDVAATAVIYTGSSPSVNGIPASTMFDQDSRQVRTIFLDKSQIGNFTEETLSPSAIRVSTLGDEIRIDAGGLGSVYSISPDAAQALIAAGHAGNSACWITDDTGKWATTAYYKDMPTVVQSINHRRPLSSRLDTLSWQPSLDGNAYLDLPSYKKIYQFRHSFPRTSPTRYAAFKTSAPVNREVTDVSSECLKVLGLGKHEPIDMLNITYTVQPYAYSRDADNRAELFDGYVKLDAELDRLFRSIDANGPGMGNTLVFVAGTPVSNLSQPDDEKWRIPTGEFSPSRAVSLLKMNLMSIYGNGDWVAGYHDRQIFLNRQLIKERGKDLAEMRRESADFLRRMSGVTYAAPIGEIMTAAPSDDSPFPLPKNIDVDTAGDVFLTVSPGWVVLDEDGTGNPRTVERTTSSMSSAFILCPGVDARTIDTPVDARVVAPTVARLLRIRSPNGSQLAPLRF